MLDSRAAAHAGRGMHNSIEWAVSAAASIAIHFLDDGFSVEIYEADGPLHIAGSMGQHSSASPRAGDQPADRPAGPLDDHAALRGRVGHRRPARPAGGRRPGPDDRRGRRTSLLRVRRNRAHGLALVLDVDTFADDPGRRARRGPSTSWRVQILRDNQWRVVEVPRGMGVADAWAALEQSVSGGLMRAADRSGIAVMVVGDAGRLHRSAADHRPQLPARSAGC